MPVKWSDAAPTVIALAALGVSAVSAYLQFASWTDFSETSVWEGGQTAELADGHFTASITTHTFFVNNGSDPVSVVSVTLVLLGPKDETAQMLDAKHPGPASCHEARGLSAEPVDFKPFTVEAHKINDIDLGFHPITADPPAGWAPSTEAVLCLSFRLLDKNGFHDVGAPLVELSAKGSSYSSWTQRLLPRQ
jgi:hypothetical protein